ncbi:hypothetical protein MCUN1_002848 [Malassezia cuniculi]|uniref:DH domain-containing protein n=1 Tax=Malassezia cuniculi TaxID=948313 RepID=A0AAF0F0E6_9BASI|nr:hypothetical protein MCUN1_002848 [Malassezia cuniculi]
MNWLRGGSDDVSPRFPRQNSFLLALKQTTPQLKASDDSPQAATNAASPLSAKMGAKLFRTGSIRMPSSNSGSSPRITSSSSSSLGHRASVFARSRSSPNASPGVSPALSPSIGQGQLPTPSPTMRSSSFMPTSQYDSPNYDERPPMRAHSSLARSRAASNASDHSLVSSGSLISSMTEHGQLLSPVTDAQTARFSDAHLLAPTPTKRDTHLSTPPVPPLKYLRGTQTAQLHTPHSAPPGAPSTPSPAPAFRVPDTPSPSKPNVHVSRGSPVVPGRIRPVPPPLSTLVTPQKNASGSSDSPTFNSATRSESRNSFIGDYSPMSVSDNAEYVVVGNGIVMHRSEQELHSWEDPDIPSELPRTTSRAVELLQGGMAHLAVISPDTSVEAQRNKVAEETTHLSATRVPLLGVSLHWLTTPLALVVLDLSFTGLHQIPPVLSQLSALEELNLSGNPLSQLAHDAGKQVLPNLVSLRVLLLDQCELDTLPYELTTLTRLQILALRRNRFTSLPSWIHMLDLDCLLLEGNEMAEPWAMVLEPLVHPLMSDVSRHFAVLSTTGSNVHTPGSPGSTPSRGSRANGSQASPGPSIARRPTREFMNFSLRMPRFDEEEPAWRRRTRRTASAASSPSAETASLRSPTLPTPPAREENVGTPANLSLPGGVAAGMFTTYLPLPQLAPPPNLVSPQPRRIACFLPVYDNSSSVGGFEIPVEHEDYVHNVLSYMKDLDSLLPQHQTHPLVVHSSEVPGDRSSPMRQGTCIKEDSMRCQRLISEIVFSERTYVAGLNELTDIYIRRAREPLEGSSTEERALPVEMERAVFGHVEGIVHFHSAVFLPLLEHAAADVLALPENAVDTSAKAQITAACAVRIADVFSSHAAYFKMYMNYVNQCDSALRYVSSWTELDSVRSQSQRTNRRSSTTVNQIVSLGRRMKGTNDGESRDVWSELSQAQQRRIQQYIRRCRDDPRHSQLNLEGYLLLPIQRIPRYRMLLEQLVQCTSRTLVPEADAALERALEHISLVVSWVNEGKRQSEQGRRLLLWQKRLRNTTTTLLQPHRRLICDGPMRLRRIVRRAPANGDSFSDMDVLEQTSMDRKVQLLLCNDLVAIVAHLSEPTQARDDRREQEPDAVELVAILRPCTVATPSTAGHPPAPPACITGRVHLRIVDTRCIVYLTALAERDAIRWCDAINAQTF